MSSVSAILVAAVLFAATADLVDPTAPPTRAAAPIERVGPQLQGILRMGSRDFAVVDGVRVSVGERVGSWTVTEIGADAVRLRNERSELTLRLAPPVRRGAATGGGTP